MVTVKPFYRPKTRHIYSDQPVKFTTTHSIIASSVQTIYTLPTDMSRPSRCQNCGHDHSQPHSPASVLPNCFFITIRRSGRDRLPLSTPHSVPISSPHSPTTSSTSQSQSHQLRDYIWAEFSNLKAEVDLDRDTLNLQRSPKSKGQLKEKAPLPWLSWSSPNGQSGQTRNKANFFAIWDRVMADASVAREGRVWVSSVLLPPTTGREETVIWSDELDVELDEEGCAECVHKGDQKGREKVVLGPVGSGEVEGSGSAARAFALLTLEPCIRGDGTREVRNTDATHWVANRAG